MAKTIRVKTPRIQPMLVTLRDGSVVEACCGPAVLALPDVAGYVPVGPGRPGVCCHRLRRNRTLEFVQSLELGHVRAWLAERAWLEGR